MNGTNSRAQRAGRLLDVMKQLHRVEEYRKIELERRLNELDNTQREVIHALNTDDALHGLFVDTTARFLRSVATEAQKVARAHEVQSQKLLENASKMKQAERLKETLDRDERRAESETQLLDIIEHHTRDPASPR
jgi:hypothetical protein